MLQAEHPSTPPVPSHTEIYISLCQRTQNLHLICYNCFYVRISLIWVLVREEVRMYHFKMVKLLIIQTRFLSGVYMGDRVIIKYIAM